MKRVILPLAATFALVGAAFADPVTVSVPKDLSSRESVAAYTSELDSAVQKVCRKAVNPVIGLAYYTYLNCLSDTRAEVAKSEPSGLYRKNPTTSVTLASN